MLHFGLNVALAAYAFVALLWVAQHVGASHTAWDCWKRSYRKDTVWGKWGNIDKVYGAYEYNVDTQKWDVQISVRATQFTYRYEHCTSSTYTEWQDAYNYAVSLSFIWVFYCGNY